MSVADALYGVAWAIRPEALAALCQIAERQPISPEAIAQAMHASEQARAAAIERLESVEQRRGSRLDRTDAAARRGTTAVVPVVGPIVRYASLFSDVSGATSVESLARDFTVAVEDPSIESILLSVDSPGGEVAGIAELGDLIYRARAVKPVWAYVSDMGTSAAYWLASATERVVVAETAALGSIGVIAAVKDPTKAEANDLEFVSSVSPNKRADPTTESGRTAIQALVDTLGDIFVAAVARNRDVDPETVTSRYGAGGLLIGRQAVKAGLADEVGSFEATLDLLAALPADDLLAPEPAVKKAAAIPQATPRKAGPAMALRERFSRFLASLDPPDAEALADALEGSAVLATAQVTPQVTPQATPQVTPQETTQEAPMAQSTSHTPHAHDQTVGMTVPSEPVIPPAVASRLATLEAENRRLQVERIEQAATTFANEQVRSMRTIPAQVPMIVALYTALSEDDTRGPAIRADGTRVNRIAMLETFFASQPDQQLLGVEMIRAAGGSVAFDRATAQKKDRNEEASAEELAEYLRMTATGRQVLNRIGANGSSHGL